MVWFVLRCVFAGRVCFQAVLLKAIFLVLARRLL